MFLNMQALSCIVHYPIKDCLYSSIKDLSEINKEKIYAAKATRLRLGGKNLHEEQCSSIPDEVDPNRHGVHLEPCYKKFTKILSHEKALPETSTEVIQRPQRLKSAATQRPDVYPKECNFCQKYRVKRQQKHHVPITITTKQAELTLKEAAEANIDQSLYFEIKDADLIAKEFKYHEFCYKEFTRKKKHSQAIAVVDERSKGDYESVIQCLHERVFGQNQAVSMSVLHDIYGLNPGDTRYRSRLKARIQSDFKDKLYFLIIDRNTPEIVINREAIDSHTLFNDSAHIVEQAAMLLRGDILNYASSIPELSWPIDLDELNSDARQPPANLASFLGCLLKSKEHPNRATASKLIQSYSSDLIFGVTRGKCITSKHFLLGLGLHNLTGQKKPVQILNHLGHCIDYNLVCEIETSQAEKSQLLATKSQTLPLIPCDENETVLTYFWVDNFDMNIETQTGHRAINSTHMIAFQEVSPIAIPADTKIEFPRSKKRKIALNDDEPEDVTVDRKKEPEKFPESNAVVESSITSDVAKYVFWIIIRGLNAADQTVSSYSGWCTTARKELSPLSPKKTVLTYLPPINAKVTDFATIFKYLSYLQKLAKEANMPFVNVTLDVGAAMNVYKLTWNYSRLFENVVVHLGDFHFMKENFGVIGKIIKGSGFEDVVFQASVCSSGSLNGVLSGTHYNRAWTVHATVSEALERLLFERFLEECNLVIPDSYVAAAKEQDFDFPEVISSEADFFTKYQEFRQLVRDGEFGLTAQFWLSMYLDLMEKQHLIHIAVHENNFDLRTLCWKFFLPLYFSLQKVNYARYGSFYVEVLLKMEKLYPGLKDLLREKGMSVQAQEKVPLRVPIDQRGEQTLNRDAKTTGGITHFASDSTGILKWTLNRAEQANNTKALLEMADITCSSTLYKPLRPSQILKSEKLVTNIVRTLKEEYINPFAVELDQTKLINLSSGIPLATEAALDVMSIRKVGEEEYDNFRNERLLKKEKGFHDPIKRKNLKLFASGNRKVQIEKSSQVRTIEANRNVLASLLSLSAKTGQVIDFEKALTYPLSSVPLSLANPDGTRRTTAKSKLQGIILDHCSKPVGHPKETSPDKSNVSAFLIDMMAVIRTLTEIPENYEELTWKFMKTLPRNYYRVDIVADTYQETSIKTAERNKRGCSEKIIIQSAKSKIPRNFNEFLKNGENKRRMISLMVNVLKENRLQAIEMLQCTKIFISTENSCMKLTELEAIEEDQLASNQEEADTKLILHCLHALTQHPSKKVVIRSPSADIDILVILLNMVEEQSKVYLDFGVGLHRKGLYLSDIEMEDGFKKCLIGFHAFTGNDYVSSFFRKGESECWKVLQKNNRFVNMFTLLGQEWDLDEQIFVDLEEYVCHVYGYRQKDVNDVRNKLFDKKYVRQGKAIDISLLPPCQSSLRLHMLRSNVIAKIWKLSDERFIPLPDFSTFGWNETLDIDWQRQAFPDELTDLLLGLEEDVPFGDDEESENEA